MKNKIPMLTLYFFQILFIRCEKPVEVSDESFRTFEKKYISLFKSPNFIPIPAIPNEAVEYHRAYRHKSARFEIRARYELPIGAPETVMYPLFNAVMANIAGTPDVEITTIEPALARKEMAAHYALTAYVSGKSSFIGSYKYCMAYALYRNPIGQLYVFYLFDDPEVGIPLFKANFNVIGFK